MTKKSGESKTCPCKRHYVWRFILLKQKSTKCQFSFLSPLNPAALHQQTPGLFFRCAWAALRVRWSGCTRFRLSGWSSTPKCPLQGATESASNRLHPPEGSACSSSGRGSFSLCKSRERELGAKWSASVRMEQRGPQSTSRPVRGATSSGADTWSVLDTSWWETGALRLSEGCKVRKIPLQNMVHSCAQLPKIERVIQVKGY